MKSTRLSTDPADQKFGHLKGHIVRLGDADHPFYVVADSDDAAEAVEQLRVPRSLVWTSDEVVSLLRAQLEGTR